MVTEQENTELIDVSDIEPEFEDEQIASEEESPAEYDAGAPQSAPIVASIKDRIAAFLVDATFLYIFYWLMLVAYRAIIFNSPIGPIPVSGMNGITFHGLYLLVVLLWFSLTEMAFGASPGKSLCRLVIRKDDGSYPTFFSVIIRNVFKPIDLILFPFFITAALLEWSSSHKRLGDFVGKTVVLRKLVSMPKRYQLSLDIIASTTGRAFAFLVDFALFVIFALGLSLLLTPYQPLISMLLLVFSPVLLLYFLVIPEWTMNTSPGKWIWGFTVCHEDGTSIGLSSALIRDLWKFFDCTPLGFLTSLSSIRHQRSGDTAAGTVVIKVNRNLKGLIGVIVVIIVSVGTLYAGLANRDSFLGADFRVNFLPSIEYHGIKGLSATPVYKNLSFKNFNFAADNPDEVRRPPTFEPGEVLFIVFEVDGYKKDGDKVWLQEDLNITYPDNTIGLKIENINDFNDEVDGEGPIKFQNNITIPDNAQIGRYGVTIGVRDKLSKRETKEQRYFYVNSPTKEAPPAGEVPAPPSETIETPEPAIPTPNDTNEPPPGPDNPSIYKRNIGRTPVLDEGDED